MLKKYHKILRIKTPETPVRKRTLSDDEVKMLLTGDVIIEEKIDGGIVGLSRKGDIPIAQGKGRYIPQNENSKQVYGLWNWVWKNYDKIMCIPEGWIVYGEWMRVKHNIFYDDLPDYFIGFDIWNGIQYRCQLDTYDLLSDWGFYKVDMLGWYDSPSLNWILSLVGKSRFSSSEMMEGLVIKNQDNRMYGKYVTREFDGAMDQHWLNKPIAENKCYNGVKTY